MYKRERQLFREKIAREPLRALYTLELLMRQTKQDVKLGLVREETVRRERQPTLEDAIEEEK